jgi:hypothetical protein
MVLALLLLRQSLLGQYPKRIENEQFCLRSDDSNFFWFKGFPFFAISTRFCTIVCGLFTYLMLAPKKTERKMLDQIEGFRLYLAKAEHVSLKRLEIP